MEQTWLEDLVKLAAINFANYVEQNFTKVYSTECKNYAWIDHRKHKIYTHGSEFHFNDLVKNHGKTDEQVYELFLQSEKLRLEKLKENENKKG